MLINPVFKGFFVFWESLIVSYKVVPFPANLEEADSKGADEEIGTRV